jgi:hypothetical protein
MNATKTLAAVALATAGLTACNVNPFGNVIPNSGQVRLNVPGADAGDGQALLVGSEASFYVATRDLANSINGGVGFVFKLVEEITKLPPTETDEETFAVWGPSEPRGLEKNSFRFTVNKGDDESFTYKLEARPKDATEESDFVIVFEGVHTPNPDADDKGTGELDVHWGAVRSLDDTECLVGDLHAEYSADAEPRTLAVTFIEVADGCRDEAPTNATYLYSEAADASGTLEFAQRKNIHDIGENKPLEEVFAIKSRWLADGQGRSDVRVSEGEIPADLAENIPGTTATTADIVECWDASFNVVYADTTPDELEPHLGHEEEGDAAQCAFADAAFAEL